MRRTLFASRTVSEFTLIAFKLSTIETEAHLGRHIGDQLAADEIL